MHSSAGKPTVWSDGPTPRIRTFFRAPCGPELTKPPISTFSPVCTSPRVERPTNWVVPSDGGIVTCAGSTVAAAGRTQSAFTLSLPTVTVAVAPLNAPPFAVSVHVPEFAGTGIAYPPDVDVTAYQFPWLGVTMIPADRKSTPPELQS